MKNNGFSSCNSNTTRDIEKQKNISFSKFSEEDIYQVRSSNFSKPEASEGDQESFSHQNLVNKFQLAALSFFRTSPIFGVVAVGVRSPVIIPVFRFIIFLSRLSHNQIFALWSLKKKIEQNRNVVTIWSFFLHTLEKLTFIRPLVSKIEYFE